MYWKMKDHWLENGPPLYVLAAAYLGYDRKNSKEKSKSDKIKPGKGFERLAEDFKSAGGVIR